MATRRPRILLYSHDTYGLGHLRRCLRIASGLASLSPCPSVLVATGSPRTQAFPLPPGCDTVKLPAATKRADGRYRARSLGLPLEALVRLRGDLLQSVERSFRPDLVLVDHAAAGMAGELLPLLHGLRHRPRRPRLVLGLRDVVDEAERVHREWDRLGVWELLERQYDRVLVYGDPQVPTTAHELGLAERFPDKVRFVGYLGHPRAPARPRDDAGLPTVVVTAGGGGDGHALLRSYAAFLEQVPPPAPFRSVVVTGPLLSHRRQEELARRYRALPHPLELLTFTDRMDELLSGAAGVVSMAGYNTVVEILSARVPALLVPRTEPRREQLERAERLARLGAVELCPPGADEAEVVAGFVARVLGRRPVPRPAVRLGGVEAVTAELAQLLDQAPGAGPGREEDRVAQVV